MATKTAARKASKAKPKATAAKKGAPRAVQVADKATFSVDDKRAQYARLIVFNYAVKQKMVAKDSDVNSVSNSVLEKAGKELAGGNILNGKDGIELLAQLSRKGATDEKVAERGLTPAYAAEVRPFIRRLQFSDSFGRRAGQRKAKAAPAKKAGKAAKAAPAGNAPEGTDES